MKEKTIISSLLLAVLALIVAACSVSYVHQQDISDSKVEVKTSQEQATDISPPSLGKDIVKGVGAVAGVVRAIPPAAPPAAPTMTFKGSTMTFTPAKGHKSTAYLN